MDILGFFRGGDGGGSDENGGNGSGGDDTTGGGDGGDGRGGDDGYGDGGDGGGDGCGGDDGYGDGGDGHGDGHGGDDGYGDGGGGMPVVHVIDTGSQWLQVEYKGENKSFHLEGLCVYGEEEGYCRSYLQEGCYPLVIRVLAYFNRSFMEPT